MCARACGAGSAGTQSHTAGETQLHLDASIHDVVLSDWSMVLCIALFF